MLAGAVRKPDDVVVDVVRGGWSVLIIGGRLKTFSREKNLDYFSMPESIEMPLTV